MLLPTHAGQLLLAVGVWLIACRAEKEQPLRLTARDSSAIEAVHAAYVSAVEKVTNENLRAGYILKGDAERTIQDARASAIGRLESPEAERGRPLADFDRAP